MDISQAQAALMQSVTYEPGVIEYEDFPQTEEPVWILGKQYSTLYDLDDLRSHVLSRLWFTYRKGFPAIGTSTFTSDTGWGCMLRCGQMLLAQALIVRHLGRDWKWELGKYEPKYFEILRMFQDRKSSNYSIHQIASMGVVEGKMVGHWFGPNTIAQVLKKLAKYDDWSGLKIHIAMDNTVVREDLKNFSHSVSPNSKLSKSDDHSQGNINKRRTKSEKKTKSSTPSSNPVLLMIPLRLGLSEVNPLYIPAIRTCFTMKQCVGLIGGKPNHAHWFIGYVGEELIFLDPHTTQFHLDINEPGTTDESFHCQYPSRLHISQIDPSIALGFYFENEKEVNDWCDKVEESIIRPCRTPMFEICEVRPSYWKSADEPKTYHPGRADGVALSEDGATCDSDDGFELL